MDTGLRLGTQDGRNQVVVLHLPHQKPQTNAAAAAAAAGVVRGCGATREHFRTITPVQTRIALH